MRFAAFQPHKRFQYPGPKPYQLDIPVISCGFLIVIIGIILVSFVWPTLMLDWHQRPQIKTFVRPEYPEDALLQRINGEVVVQYFVDEKGVIINPKIIESVPQGVFDEAALNAVNQWEYKPVKTWGKETVASVSYRLRFRVPDLSESWTTLRLAPRISEQIVYGPCSSLPEVIERVEPAPQISHKEYEFYRVMLEWASSRNECLVTFWVDETGEVKFPRLERMFRRSLDKSIITQVIAAIKQWKFKPATRDGKPITVLVTQRLDLISKE